MQVSVHTLVTNPLSSGYLSYLACVESWLQVADELVVVDGGSTDGSIELLRDWVSNDERLKVIAPQEARWEQGDRWAWPQICINRALGLTSCSGDWAIHVDADHVLEGPVDRNKFLAELERFEGARVIGFWVGVPEADRVRRRARTRSWIIDRRGTVESHKKLTYGIDQTSLAHLDYPIHPNARYEYIDAGDGGRRTYHRGPPEIAKAVADIDTIRYGHFFFDAAQCHAKVRRLDAAVSRYIGSALARDAQLKRETVLRPMPTRPTLGLHPPSVQRLLDEKWSDGMIGGGDPPDGIEAKASRPVLAALRAERQLRTVRLRRRGFKGVIDLERESPGGNEKEFDLPKLYAEQDALI